MEELKRASKGLGSTDGFLEKVSLMSEGNHYVYENDLILRLTGETKFNPEKTDKFQHWKKILDSCVEGEKPLVDSIKNTSYMKNDPIYSKEENYSRRLVQVSNDTGMEMLDGFHYWLVKFPSTFDKPYDIIIGMFTTLITAIITTLMTIHFVAN